MAIQSLYLAGSTPAALWAARSLKNRGVTICDSPGEAQGVLLDVPSFRRDGLLRSGENPEILKDISGEKWIFGGNLNHPLLTGCKETDLLRDPFYLAENASITAQCAIVLAAQALDVTLEQSDPLILGWGRIGKCLSRLLKAIGANVSVYARKERDQAILQALGYDAPDKSSLLRKPHRLVVNTIPFPVLSDECICRTDTSLILDLATQSGLQGKNVIPAPGLPGIHAPESSGKLIADTILRLSKEVFP